MAARAASAAVAAMSLPARAVITAPLERSTTPALRATGTADSRLSATAVLPAAFLGSLGRPTLDSSDRRPTTVTASIGATPSIRKPVRPTRYPIATHWHRSSLPRLQA